MKLIWPIIKDTGVYFWEELFYLVIYNLLTVLTIAPGVYMLWTSPNIDPPPPPTIYIPMAILLMSLAPYMLFSLFSIVYEISEGKAIKFSTFFKGGRQMLKQAYIWWLINVGVLIVLIGNIAFYNSLDATWSVYAGMLFVGILVAWLLTQAFALTLYPRLIEPGFKLATKNAMVIIAKYPATILVVGLISLVLSVAGIIIIPVGWFAAVALIATLLNMTTRKALKDTLAPDGEEVEEDESWNIPDEEPGSVGASD